MVEDNGGSYHCKGHIMAGQPRNGGASVTTSPVASWTTSPSSASTGHNVRKNHLKPGLGRDRRVTGKPLESNTLAGPSYSGVRFHIPQSAVLISKSGIKY